MSRTAIVNSTPLISLALLHQLDLLNAIFPTVIVPSEVAKEVTRKGKPKSQEIADWIKGKTLESINKQSIELFSFSLDMGESEVLALYYETPNSIVVIDEEKARKLAKRQNIPHIGTLGVLLLAKKKGVVKAIKPLIDQLQENGIHISKNLYIRILDQAGEL